MRWGPLIAMAWVAAAAAGAWEESPARAAQASTAPAWGEATRGGAAGDEAGPADGGARLLRAHVDGAYDAELRWPDFAEVRADVAPFYERRGWTLAWLPEGEPTDAAWQLAEALGAAEGRGLDPRDYGVETLEPRLAAARRGGGTMAERVRLDVALTVSAIRYLKDVGQGRVRPLPETRLLGRVQLARAAGPRTDAAALLEAAASAVDPARILSTAEPGWPAYRRTLGELDGWLARARAGLPEPLPPPELGPVAPERYAGALRLAARLRDLGDLAPWEAGAGGCDEEVGACRSPLAEAVARYQARHGLEATGRVDRPTVDSLNVPAERRVAQLTLALERWRWFPHRPPEAWIAVNVPAYTLQARDAEGELSMRVVVGQAYAWGTPLVAARVTEVVLRPPWSVPISIQREELLARVEADRAFLAKQDFEVLDAADRPVAPPATPALLAGLREGTLRLRQRPGTGNALGPVKIALSGPAWLYLHGTPGGELFGRSRRDFSHGCIRVEDPAALAAWVLRGEPGWTPTAIRAAIDGGRTEELTVARPITVLIGYFTAAPLPDGAFGFFEDVYGQDAALAVALREESARRGGEEP